MTIFLFRNKLIEKQKFSYYGTYNNQIPRFIYGDGTHMYI